MSNKQHKLEFAAVTARLRAWREDVVAELRSPETHDGAMEIKRQLDGAIDCLEFCQHHQIRAHSKVVVLPATQTQTPSSNYRVVEDHETDAAEHWTELEIDGESLQLYPGDVILS